MFPKRQRLDDDDNETLHRLSTALEATLGASLALATTTSFVAKPSSNIAVAYSKLGENLGLGLLPQPTTTITPTSLPPRILDFEQDVTIKYPDLHQFRLSIREFALSILPIFHQIISWDYANYFARPGSHLGSPSFWERDREFRENLSKNIINIIQNEYPDVHFIRDPCRGRSQSPEEDRGNCSKFVRLDADLMETTSKILSGRAHKLSSTLSCIIKFLYIMTELHELMQFLIAKCLASMNEFTPRCGSRNQFWDESGFQLEVMMFGFIPAAVWKEGRGRVKDIQRLDGYFYSEGRHYSLSDDKFLPHLYSFVQGVENKTLKPTEFPLHRSAYKLNRTYRVGHREYRERGFGYSDPKGDYEDRPLTGVGNRDSCIITSAEEAHRIKMGRR